MVGKQKTREELAKLYKTVLPIFQDIPFTIFYGTLLGFCRDGEFIDQDDDIDILVNKKDKEKLWFYLLQNDEFLTFTNNEEDFLQICVQKDKSILTVENLEGPIDIYFYEEKENIIQINWDGTLIFSKEDIFPLKNIIFHGISTSIPNKSEEICRQVYGDSWRTPLKKDDYKWEDITNMKRDTVKGYFI